MFPNSLNLRDYSPYTVRGAPLSSWRFSDPHLVGLRRNERPVCAHKINRGRWLARWGPGGGCAARLLWGLDRPGSPEMECRVMRTFFRVKEWSADTTLCFPPRGFYLEPSSASILTSRISIKTRTPSILFSFPSLRTPLRFARTLFFAYF